jgi:hypothetical protein
VRAIDKKKERYIIKKRINMFLDKKLEIKARGR